MRCHRLAQTFAGVGVGLLPAVIVPACGGEGGTPAGVVLFSGPASELAPHELGRSAVFRVTATSAATDETSGFTATVVTSDTEGSEFATDYVSLSGATARAISRDSGDEIAVVAIVSDPGGAGEATRAIEPPAVVVRTPVVAGETIRTSFARSLEAALEINGRPVSQTVLFSGTAERTPIERTTVDVPAGSFANAIRYEVSAAGEARVTVAGETIELRVTVQGNEYFAPGAGGLKEDVEVQITARDAVRRVRFVTEREA
jgi:hypothetical protein